MEHKNQTQNDSLQHMYKIHQRRKIGKTKKEGRKTEKLLQKDQFVTVIYDNNESPIQYIQQRDDKQKRKERKERKERRVSS